MYWHNGKCKICENSSEIFNFTDGRERFKCNYCGEFTFLNYLETDIFKDKTNFYKVSSWIHEQNNFYATKPEIDKNKFENILLMADKKIGDKFNLMMHKLYEKNTQPSNDALMVSCWFKNKEEMFASLKKAQELNYFSGKVMKKDLSDLTYDKLIFNHKTFEGIEYIENIDHNNKASKKVFVAFHFDEIIKKVFDENIKEAIESIDMIYDRVSSSSTPHDTQITDAIISKIKSARIVIADFTNHRNSVYFEAGYAMGIKIPVIWTCNKKDEKNLSFDTRQYPHILWEDGDDLAKQIINRIKVIL